MSVLSKTALKSAIKPQITANGTNSITGTQLNAILDNTVDSYQDAIPQLTTIQIAALTPTLNQLVYNTDKNYLMQYNGTIWIFLTAMFIGTAAEVAAAPDKEGQLYYDTTNSYVYFGGAAVKYRVQTAESCTCFKTVKVTLSSAQILNSYTSAVTLVPAPGAGKVIIVTGVLAILNFNSVSYATNVNAYIAYDPGDDITVGFPIDQPASKFSQIQLFYLTTDITAVANKSIIYKAAGGNPTAGDSTIDIWITYNVITL